jgi:hypothetical protein
MRSLLVVLPAVVVIFGCSSTDTGAASATGDASDGRYHPEPDGTHVSESSACAALQTAQDAKLMSIMGCVGTTRTCPALLRVEFATECMEYDQGSVDGCIEYYNASPSCDALRDRIADCVVTPYPGTEPAGCP